MRPPRFALAIVGLLAPALWAPLGLRAEEGAVPGLSLGLELDTSDLPAETPQDVRLAVDWAAIETAPGVFDWSSLEQKLGDLRVRGARVTLALRGDNPLHPPGDRKGEAPDGEWLAAWTAFARSAVKSFGGAIATLELDERPDRDWSPEVYAFVLKSSALAARAEAKAAGVPMRVAQGAIGADSIDWERALLDRDAAAYIDILPVAIEAGADPGATVAALRDAVVLHPPAPEIRVQASPGEPTAPWSSLATAVRALQGGAASAFAYLPAEAPSRVPFAAAVTHLGRRIADGYAPAPAGGIVLVAPDGSPPPGAAVLGRFLRGKDFVTLVVYEAPLDAGSDGQARLVLDTIDVKEPAVVDPVADAEYKTGPAQVPGTTKRALRVLLADHPMVVTWSRVSANLPGLEVGPEDVAVKTTRGLTAQEIIARHQEVQKVQDDHLERWTATGRVDFHFKLAQGGSSIDVAIESNYFWRRGGTLEWEQARYWINGNIVTWKRIPELPFLQPEKVVTLPLDLTFDKSYDYRLLGEDTVGGRPAYVLAFEPTAERARDSLYRGRVFIDKATFVRLRTSVVQTNMLAPVLSNEETDTYVPVVGPDGGTYTLIGRVDGQQLWTGGGRNFVVRRELAFGSFAINPPEDEFDTALKDAYASQHQMLRDTDTGFRYLEKTPDGGRRVQEHPKTDALFLLAGAFKDNSIASVVPLAGVNWFDYDLFKKKIQIDVFFAGVYAFVNLTDPSLGGTKLDLGAEASLVGLKLDDTLYVDGVEDVAQRVRRRSQYLTGRVGYPLGNFFKLTGIADLTWNQYTESSDARDALAAQNARDGTSLAFALPANHQVYAATLQTEFNRKGYSVTAAGSYSRRSSWEPWGLFDTTTGVFVGTTFSTQQQSFENWKLTAFKEWYLPKFQKLKLELDYLDGSNLDRFSQYRFGAFGDESLVGFSGTGVRFDTGYIARGGWAFNIMDVVRFDVTAETSHVRDRSVDDRFRDYTGAGFSGNLVGPWKTIWQVSYGRAILSDIPALRGDQEFRVVVLKLF
jgi:hypothetical protein